MRFGLTVFQRYYLEIHGFLDYMEICKLRMDSKKPPAEIVANCVWAFTYVPLMCTLNFSVCNWSMHNSFSPQTLIQSGIGNYLQVR